MVRILLTGGGTLGSVSPLLAIRDALPDADYLFVGTRSGPEKEFVIHQGVRYRSMGTCKLRRYISIFNLFDLLKFPFVLLQAVIITRQYRPHAVISCGGFVAVPFGLICWLFHIPFVMHQQDIKLGLANAILTPFASIITTVFEFQKKFFPADKTYCTGNPVRHMGNETYPENGSLLILGGSLGAQKMNLQLNAIVPSLTKCMHVIHVLGPGNYHQRLSLNRNYTPLRLLTDEYGKYVQQASIIISRAGMSTLTELALYRKATILLPLPHTQQVQNVDFFTARQAAVTCDQSNHEAVKKLVMELHADPSRRSALGQTLHDLFPSNANQKILHIIKNNLPLKELNEKIAFCVGVGGIGVSALALHFKRRGYTVFGSDITENEVTRRLSHAGITIYIGHNPKNIPQNTSIVVYSSAVPDNNEEIVEARKRHIDTLPHKEYLGRLSKRQQTVAISGTHGKTTTTAFLGFTLSKKFAPRVIVGAFVPQFDGLNYQHGSDTSLLIVEADEFRSHMLLLHPKIIALTNIDIDHMDFYRDLRDIQRHFQKFVDKLPADGVLVKNHDDANLAPIFAPRMITYGFKEKASFCASNLSISHGVQTFTVHKEKTLYDTFTISLPGKFNVSNALAVIAVADHLGMSSSEIRERLANFKGTWRRLELIGKYKEAPVYSDYGHHPTAIRATLKAIKEFYPKKRCVLVYQPHSYDRTEKLFTEFATAFGDADVLVLTEIYDVAGRDIAKKISAEKLFRSIQHPAAYFAPTFGAIQKTLQTVTAPDDLILIMGAGNIDGFARALAKPL